MCAQADSWATSVGAFPFFESFSAATAGVARANARTGTHHEKLRITLSLVVKTDGDRSAARLMDRVSLLFVAAGVLKTPLPTFYQMSCKPGNAFVLPLNVSPKADNQE